MSAGFDVEGWGERDEEKGEVEDISSLQSMIVLQGEIRFKDCCRLISCEGLICRSCSGNGGR